MKISRAIEGAQTVNSQPLDINTIIQSLDPAWQGEFKAFVEGGEARPEFLAYLDAHPECQLALERVCQHEIGQLRRALSKTMTKSAPTPSPNPSHTDRPPGNSSRMTGPGESPKSQTKLTAVFDNLVSKTLQRLTKTKP